MRKYTLATLVATIAVAAVLVSGTAPASETPSDTWPYYSTGATSESENEGRIDYVTAQRAEKREQKSKLNARDKEITKRIEALKERRSDVRDRKRKLDRAIGQDTFLIKAFVAIRGSVADLFNCRMGESTNNYQEHGDHPNGDQVHGAYQYLNSTWAGAFGYGDAHTAPFFIQDWQTKKMWVAGRRGEFAAC